MACGFRSLSPLKLSHTKSRTVGAVSADAFRLVMGCMAEIRDESNFDLSSMITAASKALSQILM